MNTGIRCFREIKESPDRCAAPIPAPPNMIHKHDQRSLSPVLGLNLLNPGGSGRKLSELRMDFSASLLLLCFLVSLDSCRPQGPICPPRPAPENVTEFVCNSLSLLDFPTGFPLQTQTISVEFSQLSSIGVEALQGLPKLQGLHLSNNRLKTLPNGLFRNLPSLHTLDVTNNLLEDLPPELFTHTEGLDHLSLSENHLAELRCSWFKTLKLLSILNLSHNQLKKIPPACFSKLEKLTLLDFSFNVLHTLFPEMLEGLGNLERLVLEGNPIQCIVTETFHALPKLRLISLQNTSLTHLPAGLFKPLDHLELVDLSANHLTSLEPQFSHQTTKLSLDLSGNPWACDCRLKALLSWVKDHTVSLYSEQEMVCAFPKILEGQTAGSLNGSQFCSC